MGYHLKIKLKNHEQNIERILQIASNSTFYDLHFLIMVVTRFEPYHLFDFTFKTNNPRKLIQIVCTQEDIADRLISYDELKELFDSSSRITEYGTPDFKIAKNTLLHEIFEVYASGMYCYDFGENWQFEISLIKKISCKTKVEFACLEGKGVASFDYDINANPYQHSIEISDQTPISDIEKCAQIKKWARQTCWANDFNLDIANQRIAKFLAIKKVC